MFQHFEDREDADQIPSRVQAFRQSLRQLGLQGFIVPKTDEYRNETVPPHADRLAWLTGFTGSAGEAAILERHAGLIVDSRYSLQAKAQVSSDLFEVHEAPPANTAEFIARHAAACDVIGFDANIMTVETFSALEKAASGKFRIQACSSNPIDALWTGKPQPVIKPAFLLDVCYAGEEAQSKIQRLQKEIAAKACEALFIASPTAVAWLFNLRGADISHTPVAMARCYVPVTGKPVLFIDPAKLPTEVIAAFEPLTDIVDEAQLASALPKLCASAKTVMLDKHATPLALADLVQSAGTKIVEGANPAIAMMAKKNAVEITGARAAHLRDGVAMCRFLAWLDRTCLDGALDEITAAEQLEQFRRETGRLTGISFDTISGAGPNGAIVHYRVTRRTNRKLEAGTLYLIDSGGQYLDGTTDITRTVAIGQPSAEMRRHFTLVLKGHIAIATARFPAQTRGVDLDPFARRALWQAGLDYGHGTGHGVGSFLSVHEGPASISRSGFTPLEPGMILSNEPGFYREGYYGIRIENLVLVQDASEIPGGSKPMLGFETLTLAPIDRKLIDAALLSPAESDWLNGYHARVWNELSPHLEEQDRDWLQGATQPVMA